MSPSRQYLPDRPGLLPCSIGLRPHPLSALATVENESSMYVDNSDIETSLDRLPGEEWRAGRSGDDSARLVPPSRQRATTSSSPLLGLCSATGLSLPSSLRAKHWPPPCSRLDSLSSHEAVWRASTPTAFHRMWEGSATNRTCLQGRRGATVTAKCMGVGRSPVEGQRVEAGKAIGFRSLVFEPHGRTSTRQHNKQVAYMLHVNSKRHQRRLRARHIPACPGKRCHNRVVHLLVMAATTGDSVLYHSSAACLQSALTPPPS